MKKTALIMISCMFLTGIQAFAETGYLTKNDIMYCEENYEQYKLLGDYEFLERERRTMEARVCVHLYNDPIWDYSGSYRIEKLLEHGNYYVNVEIAKSVANAKTGTVPQDKKPTTELQKAENKILGLEKRISELEKQISQKDAVINEQIKVILMLANKIKSTVFEQISLFRSL